jgi:hypothetical protein
MSGSKQKSGSTRRSNRLAPALLWTGEHIFCPVVVALLSVALAWVVIESRDQRQASIQQARQAFSPLMQATIALGTMSSEFRFHRRSQEDIEEILDSQTELNVLVNATTIAVSQYDALILTNPNSNSNSIAYTFSKELAPAIKDYTSFAMMAVTDQSPNHHVLKAFNEKSDAAFNALMDGLCWWYNYLIEPPQESQWIDFLPTSSSSGRIIFPQPLELRTSYSPESITWWTEYGAWQEVRGKDPSAKDYWDNFPGSPEDNPVSASAI